MGRMIVQKVRFRFQVGTREGAFRLNQQFEIHTSQKPRVAMKNQVD
jgi:hypothetical protein